MEVPNKTIIRGDALRKYVSPDSLGIELEKTERARHIGEQTGLFYVPRILGYDKKESFIDFEYLEDLHTVQKAAILQHTRLCAIYTRIGTALAAIHDRLTLPDEMKMPLPNQWLFSTEDNVFIHGDFTGKNVCYHEATDRIVLLDWSAARFVGERSTFGSRYFDITWFIYFLFHFMPAQSVIRLNTKGMADAFIEGYITYNSACLKLKAFRSFHLETERLKRNKFWSGSQDLNWYRHVGYFICWQWKSYRYRRYIPRLLIKPPGT